MSEGEACPSVGSQACADKVVHLHQRPHLFHLGGGEQVHLHAEALGRRGQAPELGPAVGVGGKPEAAGHLPAGLQAGLGFQLLVEIDGVFQHLRDRGRRAQLADEACGMPGRARGEAVPCSSSTTFSLWSRAR
jgi:hypothetical protein